MSDSTTPTPGRRRRWRTPLVAAAVSGGLLLGGYGIAAAADSTPTPSSPEGESSETAPPTPSAPGTEAPNRVRPDAAPGRGEGCDEAPSGEAPSGQAPSDQAPSDQGTAESSATATT